MKILRIVWVCLLVLGGIFAWYQAKRAPVPKEAFLVLKIYLIFAVPLGIMPFL